MDGQNQQQPAIVQYSPAIIPADSFKSLILDDSPDIFFDWLWEFFGVDIQNANIKPWDFDNALDLVAINIIDKIAEYKESDWDNIVLAKVKRVIGEDGRVISETVIAAYHINLIWDMIFTKTYFKLCRGRDGFNLGSLTTNKTDVKQNITGMGGQQQGVISQEKRSKWGL